jgi:transcriptional regulator with XRE-family HTH domain
MKPTPADYPDNPVTIGEHLRKRRMDLGLRQCDVAPTLGVTPCTVTNWELGRARPEVRYYPAIMGFLGYDPEPLPDDLSGQLKWLRCRLGLSQEKMAKRLGVDPNTLLAGRKA